MKHVAEEMHAGCLLKSIVYYTGSWVRCLHTSVVSIEQRAVKV